MYIYLIYSVNWFYWSVNVLQALSAVCLSLVSREEMKDVWHTTWHVVDTSLILLPWFDSFTYWTVSQTLCWILGIQRYRFWELTMCFGGKYTKKQSYPIGVITATWGLVPWELEGSSPESARGDQGRLSRRGKGSEAGWRPGVGKSVGF